jgi:osmotically-inducible protein OsmY
MLDSDLYDRVVQELYFDPSVDQPAIGVFAEDGAVTIRGTVGSLAERRHTKDAVERVAGVESVHNHLNVRHLTKHGREDAEMRGRVLQLLMLSDEVPSTVDAWVNKSFVTLTGSVTSQSERDKAKSLAESVPGVTGLLDETLLNRPRSESVQGSTG